MEYCIWLSNVLRYGNGKAAAILERFGTAKAVYDASKTELESCGLLSADALSRAKNKSLNKSRDVISYCKKEGITIVTYEDERYPLFLRNIPDLPLVIYYKGTLPDFYSVPSVCIVGPRKCSQYGIKASYSLSARLSKGGMIIVSGGAVGVDAAAHEGAMASDGVTALLLPCGFGYDYLKANEDLRQRILKNGGCILTEFPPKYPVKQGAFQIRNRLMSALSLGTVVIEAGEPSGALITARHALEQGKDIFVIPGNPGVPQYIGSNKLLRDGAKPLLSAMDIFDEYIGTYYDKLDIEKAFGEPLKSPKTNTEYNKPDTKENKKPKDTSALSEVASAIYTAAPDTPFCVDELSVYNDYNAVELMTAIAELELCGYISAVPGGRYVKE